MMHMIPNISLTATMRMLLKSPWMPRANVSLIWCRSRHHIAPRNPCATLRGCEPPLSTARNPPLRFGCEPKAHIPTPLRLTASPIASLKGCHAEGTRRTATTCHYAADLRRGSGWLLESAACHGATLHLRLRVGIVNCFVFGIPVEICRCCDGYNR